MAWCCCRGQSVFCMQRLELQSQLLLQVGDIAQFNADSSSRVVLTVRRHRKVVKQTDLPLQPDALLVNVQGQASLSTAAKSRVASYSMVSGVAVSCSSPLTSMGRLRVIHAGSYGPIEVSVDGHRWAVGLRARVSTTGQCLSSAVCRTTLVNVTCCCFTCSPVSLPL